jgi:hypothetical protein
MRAILINSKERTIESIHFDETKDELQQIYQLVGCKMFECVSINEYNDVYVDEEGLLNVDNTTKFFKLKNGHQPLAGNGLILGLDVETGETIDTNLSVEWVKSQVTFHDIFEVALGLV